MTTLAARADGRRPGSAKARNRGRVEGLSGYANVWKIERIARLVLAGIGRGAGEAVG